MKFGSAFAGIGGFDLGLEGSGMEGVWQIEIEPFCRRVLAARFPKSERHNDIRTCRGLTASVPASHARIGRSRDRERACQENVASSFTSLRESCTRFDPLGSSSRMFPDFSVVTTDETLRKSSGFSWSSAGMGFNGACLTASFSESPSVAAVCSLSDILESHVPQRFFLSPRAAQGILRRAKKRGRELPPRLQAALESLAMRQDEGGRMTSTSQSADLSREAIEKVAICPTAKKPRTDSSYWDDSQQTDTPLPQLSTPEWGTTDGPAVTKTSDCSSQHTRSGVTPEESDKDTTQPTPSQRTCETEAKGQRTTLQASADSEAADQTTTTDRPTASLSVRRLTPTECEILQGFPKGWTLPDIELWETQSPSPSLNGLAAESSPTEDNP